jgi:hypothetical protein
VLASGQPNDNSVVVEHRPPDSIQIHDRRRADHNANQWLARRWPQHVDSLRRMETPEVVAEEMARADDMLLSLAGETIDTLTVNSLEAVSVKSSETVRWSGVL